MGGSLQKLKDEQKELAMRTRLADLKQGNRERNIRLSMEMAATRDRVWWFGSFYTVMGVASVSRMAVLRKFSPLPLNSLPFVVVPLWMAYMADYAYFNKADRISRAARKIRTDENHWFNEPLELPVYMEPYYLSMRNDENRKLIEAGLSLEKDWACFSTTSNVHLVKSTEDSGPVFTIERLIKILKEGPV